MKSRTGALALASALAALLAIGCEREPEKPRPILVLAVDGAEWSVIEELWEQGELPNLKALAERGVRSELRTAYSSKSPVVWTTIATGVEPERHGIEDFVISTERGDVPVTSSARRVPALWNMTSTAGRRVAVLGWWASWPPEEVNGIVVSDRAARQPEGGATPAAWWAEVSGEIEYAQRDLFPPGVARKQDELIRAVARRIGDDDFDIRLVYLRSVDTMSHSYWRYFRPRRYDPLPQAELDRYADRIPRAYAAVDEVLAELVEGAGSAPESNILVISDHGFYGLKRERRRVACDLDGILERLGLLRRDHRVIDLEATRVYTHGSPRGRPTKLLRTPDRSTLDPASPSPVLSRRGRALEGDLAAALARVRYGDGAPLFELRLPTVEEVGEGAELVVEVLQPQSVEALELDGEPLSGLVTIERLSGSHGGNTRGILIAAGPDIDPTADLAGIRIQDVAPTLLFGLGLPVARDFAGRAWTELFKPEFRERFPLETIPSWGTRDASGATHSNVDQELIEELEALGYL